MRWIGLGLCLVWGGCGVELPQDESPGISREVDYHATWNTEGVHFSADGFDLTNNLGYTIEVNRGYLVFYSSQLVPCEEPSGSELTQGRAQGLDWTKWWSRIIGMRTAHAGHGDVLDPSVMAQSYVEDLIAPEALALGRRSIEATRYCQVHYLVARGPDGAMNLPDEPDMVGVSLWIEGSWSFEGQPAESFSILSSAAYGTIHDLSPGSGYESAQDAVEVSADPSSLRVEIERNLYGLFQDLDFRGQTETQIERRMLQNVIESTSIYVELEP